MAWHRGSTETCPDDRVWFCEATRAYGSGRSQSGRDPRGSGRASCASRSLRAFAWARLGPLGPAKPGQASCARSQRPRVVVCGAISISESPPRPKKIERSMGSSIRAVRRAQVRRTSSRGCRSGAGHRPPLALPCGALEDRTWIENDPDRPRASDLAGSPIWASPQRLTSGWRSLLALVREPREGAW
jgi:hypothetical protein